MRKYLSGSGVGEQVPWFVFDADLHLGSRVAARQIQASFGDYGLKIDGFQRLQQAPRKPTTVYVLESEAVSEVGYDIESCSPYLGLSCIGFWLVSSLFYDDSPYRSRYTFSGPMLGYINLNRGYEAASSGSNSRRIHQLQAGFDLSPQGFKIGIAGVAGPMIPDSVGHPYAEALQDIHFSVDFDVPADSMTELLGFKNKQWYDQQLARRLERWKPIP